MHVEHSLTERAETLGRAMAHAPRRWREQLGDAVGRLSAPALAAIARVRHARVFHPDGLTFTGHAVPVESALGSIGAQLAGRVMARCSPALHRLGDERLASRIDVLGLALRFRPGNGPPLDHRAALGDQDLLFATIRSPLTLLLAPFATDTSDFAGNRYWAVSPFSVHDHGRVRLRLSPVEPPKLDGSRQHRLRAAVDAGRAAWWLEARPLRTLRWYRVSWIGLERTAVLDDRALRFDPFRTGAGVMPTGFVHAIRSAAYAASQRGRRT